MTHPNEITHEEACEIDDRISIHWPKGTLLVLKVCGYDRVGMVMRFLKVPPGSSVDVQYLMIDTVLSRMSGTGAWAIFGADRIQRRLESWDVLSLKSLMFPPDLKEPE